MSLVAVVEDHPRVRHELELLLEDNGHEVSAAASAEELLAELDRPGAEAPDLLLADIRLPGMSGLELVHRLGRENRLPPTVVISGEATLSEAVEAVSQAGVIDFLEKPFSSERLLHTVRQALEMTRLRRHLDRLRRLEKGTDLIIGASPAIERVRELMARAATSHATVLLRGASGTGKELVADGLHRLGSRRGGPFVKINCAALPGQLVEDELFGHVRGAFTDARADRAGVFEEADGGTLLLDEIGDMDVALQGRLLRVLEDGRVRRVGASRDRAVDVRVVAATHRDLEAAVASGGFRADLYYRIAQLVIHIPPLAERPGDVVLLVNHFLVEACRRVGREPPRLGVGVLHRLEHYLWPGNVRELKNLCERLAAFAGADVGPGDLPAELTMPSQPASSHVPVSLRAARQQWERQHIEMVLDRTGWNVAAAARLLEVNRSHLHARMAELGISRSHLPSC